MAVISLVCLLCLVEVVQVAAVSSSPGCQQPLVGLRNAPTDRTLLVGQQRGHCEPLRLRGGVSKLGDGAPKELTDQEAEQLLATLVSQDMPLIAQRGGSANADASASKKSWMMRSTSYSVLDESKVQEPGLGALASEDTDNLDPLSEAMVTPATATSPVDTAAFAKKAEEQARSQSQSRMENVATEKAKEPSECRVQAALSALDENAESHEDFKRYNIVLVASEHASYAKTGGLADVVDKLSLALARRGHRVMTVVPMYGNYDGVKPTGVHRGFGLFGGGHTVQYFHKWLPLGEDRCSQFTCCTVPKHKY